MKFQPTRFNGLYTISLEPKTDSRGWFARTFCKKEFAEIGFEGEWKQINQSYTKSIGTLRGLHFQYPPYQEIKLIRCIRGRVFDVAVDIRNGSKTFMKWFSIELSDKNKTMIFIPPGFAHGFLTLSNNCELIYHHSEFYTPESEGSIRFDDPAINIHWPQKIKIISSKDSSHPDLDKNFKGINL